jgi:hypothetical protein
MVELPVKTVPPLFHPKLSSRWLRSRTSASKGCCCPKLAVNANKKTRYRATDFFMISNLLKISEPKSINLLNESEQLIRLCLGIKEVDKMN